MKRYFTYKDEKSDKFWSIEVQGVMVTVVFGKTGTAGNTNIKEYFKEEDARKDAEKLILTEILSGRSEDDILAFQEIFQRLHATSYTSDLWAAAYIVNGGCSDDGFDYFRGWLIAQGKETYYNTLENPEYLVRVISTEEAGEIECEEIMSAAGQAYEAKTGIDYDTFLDKASSIAYPEITMDWQEGGDSLKNKYPKLWKKFFEG